MIAPSKTMVLCDGKQIQILQILTKKKKNLVPHIVLPDWQDTVLEIQLPWRQPRGIQQPISVLSGWLSHCCRTSTPGGITHA